MIDDDTDASGMDESYSFWTDGRDPEERRARSAGYLPQGTRFMPGLHGKYVPVIPPSLYEIDFSFPPDVDPDEEFALDGLETFGLNPVFLSNMTHSATIVTPKLRNDERGLLLMPPVHVDGEAIRTRSRIDPQELRLGLLLWDRIETPLNNAWQFRAGADAYFLQREGILTRSRVWFSPGHSPAEAAIKAPLAVFRALEEADPGKWSLARGERALSFIDGEVVPDQGILLSLNRAIPVPDRDVPIADILEFRARRRAELLSLRYHLEDVYQSVVAAPDRPLAQSTALGRLDQSVADHVRAALETRLPLRISNLGAAIAVDWKAGAVAAWASTAAHLSLPATALAMGAATLSPSLTSEIGFGRKKVEQLPFEYISSFSREVFAR